jgi:toxin FitB
VILVDTNVLSEPLRARADPRVVGWLDRQAADTLFISAVTVSEILFGVAALAAGRRRNRLAVAFETEILRLFAGRILAFDLGAARAYAALMSAARARGLSISVVDGQIAAIAKANGLSVATRDEAPFRAAGLAVVNPWSERDPSAQPLRRPIA